MQLLYPTLLTIGFLALSGCSFNSSSPETLKISSTGPPIQVEVTNDRTSSAAIDMDFTTNLHAWNLTKFPVVMSNGELVELEGVDFNAKFYHYSKLLVVAYTDLDSVKERAYFNNPMSWMSEEWKD